MEYQREDRQIWLMGLLADCPFGDCLDDCPLKTMRQLPLKERIALGRDMPEEDLDRCLEHHQRCLALRESSS